MLKKIGKQSPIVVLSFLSVLLLLLNACGGSAPSNSNTSNARPVRGGTWIDDLADEPDSLIPDGSSNFTSGMVDQAIYLALFYGDASGRVHAGMAKEVPTLANGDVSPDAKTWTFHIRPNLVWSDGQPMNADDVDFSWKLWLNPKFGAASTSGIDLINSADVSADKLTITFHLKQASASFLATWVDGASAPLPAHIFSKMPPDQVLKSSQNLDPTVAGGPFMMSESKPGDHYTVIRNPKYYLASEGLPYLDSIVFRIVKNSNTILTDLQQGTIDSSYNLGTALVNAFRRLTDYKLGADPNTPRTEEIYINFKNPILGKHREVRQAMAMAIDHQALLKLHQGFATPICTDHPPFYMPGYQPDAKCPVFSFDQANALLDQNGWIKGADGIRTKDGQRLEFTYSTPAEELYLNDDELVIQADFMKIGIKLTIHNYPASTLFGTILPDGKPGEYDLAEFINGFGYDADDSIAFACNQIPPNGYNINFYCNPQLDALFAQEQATADPAVRQRIFDEEHQIYLTDFPFITLYSPLNLYISKNGTHNYAPAATDASETVNVWEWWCDGGKCPHS